MRALQVIPSIALESSGPSYSVRRLMESLRHAGCDAEILATEWTRDEPQMDHVTRTRRGLGPKRLGSSPAMQRVIEQRCKTRSLDILHNHGMWQLNALYAARSGNRHQIPVVQSPRGALSRYALSQGSSMKRLFWPLLQRRALERCSCFHATAQSEVEDIRAHGFRQPVALIPNGIDLPRSSDLSSSRSRSLLFLGRLHPVKGIPDLLEAWSRVAARFPEWNVKIAGEDWGYHGSTGYRRELESLAERLACPRVTFLGEVRGIAKFNLMSESLLFILPSHSENFGIAVAEALASGTPAIVTHGAPWSGLDREGAGWWIAQSPDAIADCLTSAMSMTDASLVEMGQRGRQWMARDFGWDSIGARMADTYRWIVSGGACPPWIQTT